MKPLITFKDLNDFEIRWLTNNLADFKTNNENAELSDEQSIQVVNHIAECIVKGDYESVLQMDLDAFGFSLKDDHDFNRLVRDFITDSNDFHRQVKEFILIFIGISALQEFVRCNFCGPRNSVDSYTIISNFLQDISDPEVPTLLSLDGESVYSNAIHLKLLLFSRKLFIELKASATSYTIKWWLLRCTFLHQSLLPENNQTLNSEMCTLISEIDGMEWLSKESISYKLIFKIECCHIYLYYGDVVKARECLEEARNITGLEIELSGAVGKRTQYQKKPVAQLFVKLKRNNSIFSNSVQNNQKSLPPDLPLQDDLLLNKVQFIGDSEQIVDDLCAEEQIVLLAHCCLNCKNGPFDELSKEETISYVNCLLSQPQVWSIYLKVLIMRCKAEKGSARHIDRAVMQLETIIESITKPNPHLREREKFFFCTSFPTFWKLEKDLADLFLSVGRTQSALDIYERLKFWEEMVHCCIRLGRTSQAEKTVRDLIKKEENAMLWCLLGDITENTEHYLRAWDLSNHRSARAQRSLGYYYYRRKEYKQSLPHFILSLEINHLQPQVWFSTGHAATQDENFELAARAYRQVVMFDEDNFEAWNNLANAYIKTKQKVRAWRSFQEALKCNYDEWRVWENFLLVSTDIRAFEDSLRAWHRLLDIKGKFCDTFLLELLIQGIVEDLPDINDCPSSRLKQRALELLGRITSITTNEPKVWELYSLLTCFSSKEIIQKDTLEKAVLFQQKAIRYYNTKGSWERDFNMSKEVLISAQKLAELYCSYITLLDDVIKSQQKTSARLNLQSVLSRAKKFIDIFPDTDKSELNIILDSIQQTLNEIMNL